MHFSCDYNSLIYLNPLLYNCAKNTKSILEFKSKNKLLSCNLSYIYRTENDIALMIADVIRNLITT